MIFRSTILTTVLLANTFKLSECNLFENRPSEILLAGELRNDHNIFVNTEIWNLAQQSIRPLRATDPYDLESNALCSSPSSVWLQEQTALVSSEDLDKMLKWNLYQLPFAYKLYIENAVDTQEYFGIDVPVYSEEYFGVDGEYTEEIKDVFEKAQDFWSGSGVVDRIYVRGAHGSDLEDREKLIPTLELLFEGSYDEDYTVEDHADEIQDLIERLPGQYEFPLLTFNAFATDAMDDVDPSIIIGDGYFEFQKASSSDSEGPEYALTHEFAHHVMYAMGLSFEDYKKEELMADAFAAYFLANNSGGDMTSEEISSIHRVAYSIGDCVTGDELHHGTPKQRHCATVWGATFADSEDGRILNSRELYARFNSWFSEMDNLDEDCAPIALSSAASKRSISPSTALLLTLPGLLLA